MRNRLLRRRMAAATVLAALAACTPSGGGGVAQNRDFAALTRPAAVQPDALSPAQGEIIGSGPVRVAVILPLSGSAGAVGRSMANGALLAMDHVLSSGGQGVHLVLKDAGTSAQTARAATQQALDEGAQLIIGPLTAETVAAAGAIAQPSGVPLIGFSSTSGVATEGVYLLSVLPEAEIMRALGYARAQGRQSIAAIVPDTPLGRAQAEILRQAASETGIGVSAIEMFATEAQARTAIERLGPAMRSGQIDTLYLPDRVTAPSFALLLEADRVPRERLMLIGSGEWDGDRAIAAQAYLTGAVYPVIDPAGLAALTPSYRARFGSDPHQFATLSFTAVLVANDPGLTRTVPRYGNGLLSPGGFMGRDGPFRFHFDGRGEYGLVMRQIQPQGPVTIEGARLGGLPLATYGGGSVDAGIPPAAEFR